MLRSSAMRALAIGLVLAAWAASADPVDPKQLAPLAVAHTKGTGDPTAVYAAGVDPDAPLDAQAEHTLLWKRYPKGYKGGFGDRHVVHGHNSFADGPELYEGRTNLDTLAWRTGRLVTGVFDDAKPGGPVDFVVVRGPPA